MVYPAYIISENLVNLMREILKEPGPIQFEYYLALMFISNCIDLI